MDEIISGVVSGAVAGLVVAILLSVTAFSLKGWRRRQGIRYMRRVAHSSMNKIMGIPGEPGSVGWMGPPINAQIPADIARNFYFDALRYDLEAALDGAASELIPREKVDIKEIWAAADLFGKVGPHPYRTKELIGTMLRHLTRVKWLNLAELPAEPWGVPYPPPR